MDVIFEPALITSLVFSLLIGMLSKRLARFGECLIVHISLFPKKIRMRVRILKWQYKKDLILSARNQHQVTWAIVRTYTLLIFFVSVVVLYLLLITIGPLKGFGSLPVSVQALIASPIYIFEVLWILQKEKAQGLVKAAGKGVTKPLI